MCMLTEHLPAGSSDGIASGWTLPGHVHAVPGDGARLSPVTTDTCVELPTTCGALGRQVLTKSIALHPSGSSVERHANAS